jgi:phage gpG-like protein
MTTAFSLLEAAAHFAHLGHTWDKATHAALEIAARIVEAEAKRLIGTHDAGWPALKPETIARKATGDSPLLETGELRDSIQHNSSPTVAHIGTNNPKGVWHELGTSRVPPRPFLSTALKNKEKVIARAVRQVVGDYLAAGRMDFDFTKAALHALRHLWQDFKELGHELAGGDDSKSRR